MGTALIHVTLKIKAAKFSKTLSILLHVIVSSTENENTGT